MNKKAYIDWLKGMIDKLQNEIEWYKSIIGRDYLSMPIIGTPEQNIAEREIQIHTYRICLNHIKGR